MKINNFKCNFRKTLTSNKFSIRNFCFFVNNFKTRRNKKVKLNLTASARINFHIVWGVLSFKVIKVKSKWRLSLSALVEIFWCVWLWWQKKGIQVTPDCLRWISTKTNNFTTRRTFNMRVPKRLSIWMKGFCQAAEKTKKCSFIIWLLWALREILLLSSVWTISREHE